MKKIVSLITGIAAITIGCNNPRTNFTDIPVVNDSSDLAAKVDSAHRIGQDGLDYDPLNTGTYNQLPDTVTQWLNKKYAGWSLPVIPEDYLKETKNTAPGPFYLKSDLDKDGTPDYVVLFQYQDSVIVAVYLVRKTGQLQEIILEQNPLSGASAEERNLMYLISPEKENNINNTQTNNKIVPPKQAFGIVTTGNNIRFYFFNGKSFSMATSQ